MKTPRTTDRTPAKNPAARPGDPGSRSWLGRHRGPGLIVLALALVAAAWAGWRIFGPTQTHAIRHVVLISIDTCRADHLGCYGFHRATTPSIDAVAKDAALFYRALTPVPMTTPAHSSMLTGAYPPTHGVRMNNGQRLGESSVTLATVLKQAGFRTAAFVGGFPLDAQFGLNQGFETYDCQFSRTSDRSKTVSERTADEVNRPALAWLEENARAGDGGKGFFLFLHYFDPHAPYQPPKPYAADFADDLYSGEIAYVDHCIGQVMDRLRAMGLYDNTLVIITGDHGEGLGEHGEMAHAFYIYDSTLRVPLIIRSPGGGGGAQDPAAGAGREPAGRHG
ncbi:MAG: sulfatase [Planctomycetota bacterium]|nr:sulfatase [Planctomycetota bacterium]